MQGGAMDCRQGFDSNTPAQPRGSDPVATSPVSIRERVFDCIAFSAGLTPDEVAQRLMLSVLTVRPRCSELVRTGRLIESGGRRANTFGRLAKVLIVSSPVHLAEKAV